MGYALSITFAKIGLCKYISHLDLLRLFGRALRRAGIPFEVSKGFSKHPMISIKRALKLGIESENEEAKFILSKEMPAQVFKQRMQKQLPEGIFIKQARGQWFGNRIAKATGLGLVPSTKRSRISSKSASQLTG